MRAMHPLLIAWALATASGPDPRDTFTHRIPTALTIDAIDHRHVVPPDVFALLEEDAAPTTRPVPHRVARAIPFDQSWLDSGSIEPAPDGGTLWRLRVTSPGAVFLSFMFTELELPVGATLRIVSVDRQHVAGPITHETAAGGRFGSPMIAGDSAILELHIPDGAGDPTLVLESVSHGYRDVLGMGAMPLRGGRTVDLQPPRQRSHDFSCQRDVNCPEGQPFQDEKRAVAEGYDGQYICSGQLVNNVRENGRYLYLTAAHCGFWQNPAGMTFYWNYENSGCGTGDATFLTSQGATGLFHSTAADVDLLELQGSGFEDRFDVYFLGWDRSNVAPTRSASMGFPADKPKQVHVDDDPAIDCGTGRCSGGFGRDFWRVQWEVGVTEGGSSGGSLLDQNHRLVGVLTGGLGLGCDESVWDEFAKIAPVWNGLQPHLDPDGSGVTSWRGRDGRAPSGPGPARDPRPASGAIGVTVGTTLGWTAGEGAVSHDVYLGTAPDLGASAFQGNQVSTTFTPAGLGEDTTYYWRVDEVTATETITGPTWSFTTVSVDVVHVTRASWDAATGRLRVRATSTGQPEAVLTVVGHGTMRAGRLRYRYDETTSTPPAMVTVSSSFGGTASSLVDGVPVSSGTLSVVSAVWRADRSQLRVVATSTAQPPPTLEVTGHGTMRFRRGRYILNQSPVDRVTEVTVVSSDGETLTVPVRVRGTP